jgi:hypothetical protein
MHDAWAIRPGDIMVTLQANRDHDVTITARTTAEIRQLADDLGQVVKSQVRRRTRRPGNRRRKFEMYFDRQSPRRCHTSVSGACRGVRCRLWSISPATATSSPPTRTRTAAQKIRPPNRLLVSPKTPLTANNKQASSHGRPRRQVNNAITPAFVVAVGTSLPDLEQVLPIATHYDQRNPKGRAAHDSMMDANTAYPPETGHIGGT